MEVEACAEAGNRWGDWWMDLLLHTVQLRLLLGQDLIDLPERLPSADVCGHGTRGPEVPDSRDLPGWRGFGGQGRVSSCPYPPLQPGPC